MAMKKIHQEKIVKIYASTPSEFEECLVSVKKKFNKGSLFVALSVCDPRILICPFHFTDTSVDKLKSSILAEAIEIMSSPADDIFVDYQVFEENGNEIKGIYVCCKKVILGEYRTIAYKHNVILIGVTEYFLGLVNDLQHKNIDFTKNIAVLDLERQGCINLGVIQNDSCEFLRKIPYETLEDAKVEISRSLKYACAQSANKDFDEIYFIGPESIHKDLIESIENVFSMKVQVLSGPEQNHIGLGQEDFFKINLLGNQTLSIEKRKTISMAVKIVLTILAVIFAFNMIRIFKINNKIKSIKSTYTQADKNDAQKLLNQSIN